MATRSESRVGYAVRVLAVHTSEGIDKPVVDDAAALRDASWWEGSSHAIADNDPGSLLTPADGCVPYDRASWTLRSGNRWSENIELIAQAGWTRAQWLARPTLLDRCAYWLAVRSKARNIPLVKLTPQQYRAGGRGVIGHNDHTVGYSDGTHWDPGPGFPWDVVLAKATAYRNGTLEDDMPYFSQWPHEEKLALAAFIVDGVLRTQFPMRGGRVGTTSLEQEIAWLPANLTAVAAAASGAADVEELRSVLLEAVQAGKSADAGATADEIVDALAARLGKPA
jgi:hypothetical protein